MSRPQDLIFFISERRNLG